MMPSSAAARLRTRLKKKRMLIHRAEAVGVKLGVSSRDEIVALMAGDIFERFSWVEIWYAMSWFVIDVSPDCRSWYVWTTKVVRIAENNAA